MRPPSDIPLVADPVEDSINEETAYIVQRALALVAAPSLVLPALAVGAELACIPREAAGAEPGATALTRGDGGRVGMLLAVHRVL